MRSCIFCITLAAIPLAAAAIVDPSSYMLGWNQGRAGLIFAFILVSFEVSHTKRLQPLGKERLALISASTVAATAYFASQPAFQTQLAIEAWGNSLNVALIYSWIWLWDYIVYFAYVMALLLLLIGLPRLRSSLTGPIYLGGMLTILALDASFPYGELGVLQMAVPIMLHIEASAFNLLGVGAATVAGNILTITGRHGPFSLAVFWPSAGVHSIIIYSFVMAALLAKFPFSRSRWLKYFSLGVAGTVGINMLRILLLSIYVALVSTRPADFEAFHAIAGEALFLPWMASYLLLVTWLEKRRSSHIVSARLPSLPSLPS